jgi:DNA-binding response OmpR family regulator
MANGVVLVVDDDARIRDICRRYLEQAAYVVLEAEDGEQALRVAAERRPDLVVLDILLPGRDGIQVLTELRQQDYWTPVLLLTALTAEDDRITGLKLGADDYLTKPFSPRELVARVEAVLRRVRRGAQEGGDRIQAGAVTVDEAARKAWCGGMPLTLTPREFDLLAHLVRHPGRTWTRAQLLEQVWGFDFEGDERTVDVHITRLRAKLEQHGASRYIETVWGVGYRFVVPQS